MADEPLLRAEIGFRQRALDLEVSLSLRALWTSLFGVSGSGKTTILRAIAGFVRPERGRIVLGRDRPQVVFDAAADLSIAAHERPVRSAGQQAWLFPGTVRENAGAGVLLRERRERVDEVLRRFRLDRLADANVKSLSGGGGAKALGGQGSRGRGIR